MYLSRGAKLGVALLAEPVRALMLQWGCLLDSQAAQAHLLTLTKYLVTHVQVWELLLPVTKEWLTLTLT